MGSEEDIRSQSCKGSPRSVYCLFLYISPGFVDLRTNCRVYALLGCYVVIISRPHVVYNIVVESVNIDFDKAAGVVVQCDVCILRVYSVLSFAPPSRQLKQCVIIIRTSTQLDLNSFMKSTTCSQVSTTP